MCPEGFYFQYQPKSRLYYDKSYQEAITKEQVCEAASKGNSDLKSDKKVNYDIKTWILYALVQSGPIWKSISLI